MEKDRSKRQSVVVKICGLTNWEDTWNALQAGADFLGFVCNANDPRYIDPEAVRIIVQRLHREKPIPPPYTVGIFADAAVETVQAVLAVTGLDYGELQGDETPAVLQALGRRAYKKLRPHSAEEADADAGWYAPLAPKGRHAPKVLVDAYHPDLYGEDAAQLNWDIQRYLTEQRFKIIMGGGLTPANVVEAIRYVRPWGVNVNCGVESDSGRKDPTKVIAFIQAAKHAFEGAP